MLQRFKLSDDFCLCPGSSPKSRTSPRNMASISIRFLLERQRFSFSRCFQARRISPAPAVISNVLKGGDIIQITAMVPRFT